MSKVSFGSRGTGSGAAAYSLGPAPNTFANNAARNAQANGDSDWLAQYNDNRFFWIRTGTNIQRRNAAGDGWENVTTVIQGPRGRDGDDGDDGDDATPVVANPSGTDGDALTRISIAGANYNIQGGTGDDDGDGMAASWDRRLAPAVTLDGTWLNSFSSGSIDTSGSRAFGSSSPTVYVQFTVPDSLRAAVKAGLLALRLKLNMRVASITSTTPVVLRMDVVDNDFTGNPNQALTPTIETSHAMNTEGRIDSSQVFRLPNVRANSGAMFVRIRYRSSPGGNNVTLSRMTLEAAAGGLNTVAVGDLDGVPDSRNAGHVVTIGSDTDEFALVDPASLALDIWDLSTRNAISDFDRFAIAWAQGSGQPNRGITFETLRYALQQPIITQFDITGTRRVAAGTNIGGNTYRYAAEVSQPGHVSAARIVGFSTSAGNPISPISPSSRTVLATLAAGSYAHASGEVTIPNGIRLANAGDLYTLRLEVYVTGQTVGTDRPFAYHDFHIEAQADSGRTHFFHILSTEAAADYVPADDDISTAHGVAGNWEVTGIPDSGMHRIGWAVPTSDLQPVRWEQGGTDISPTIETAVARTIGGVDYNIYLLAAANAVTDAYNGQTIVVST